MSYSKINLFEKDFNFNDYVYVDKELSITYPSTEIEILEKFQTKLKSKQTMKILMSIRQNNKFWTLFPPSNIFFNVTNVTRMRIWIKFPPSSNILHLNRTKARSPIFLKYNFVIFLIKKLKTKISSNFSIFFQTILIRTYPYKNIFFLPLSMFLYPSSTIKFYCYFSIKFVEKKKGQKMMLVSRDSINAL